MKIDRIVSNLMLSNMYVLSENQHMILIDPCEYSFDISGYQVDYILLTHEHYDHISGVNYWKKKTGAKVTCNSSCATNIKDSKKNLSCFFKEFCQLQTMVTDETIINKSVALAAEYVTEADIVFEDIMKFEWQGHKIQILSCPGHSLGSVIIIVDDQVLFSGDSVFRDYPTECGMPGGSKRKWEKISEPIINKLSKDLHVYPGHLDDFILEERKVG